MKLLASSIISIILMITFCIGITFIIRLSAHLIFGGEFLFSVLDIKEGVTTGAMIGLLLSLGT